MGDIMENAKRGSISLNFGLRGWLVIIYCFLSFVIGGAFLGVWQITITQNATLYGWNSTVLFSLTNVAGVLMCLIELWISRMLMKAKVSCAKLGIGMFVIYVIAAILMKVFSTNMLMFSLMFIVGYITTNGQSMMVNGVLVGNWWPRRRGMVIGITTIGVPLGSAFGNGFYNIFVSMVGPDNVFFIYAAAGAVIVLLGLLFIRDFPEQVGAYPDNDKNLSSIKMKEEFEAMRKDQEKNNPWNFKTLLSTPQVWLIILMGIVSFNSNGIFMMQSMNRLVVFGPLELNQAMFMIMISSFVALVGSPLIGVIDSKFGTKNAGITICVLALICTVLQIPGNYMCMLLGMVIFGVVMGGCSNIVVSLASDAFNRESSSRAFSLIQPVMHLITMGINEIYLVLVSRFFHNYVPIYIIYSILLVVCIVVFGLKYDPSKIQEKDAKLRAEMNR